MIERPPACGHRRASTCSLFHSAPGVLREDATPAFGTQPLGFSRIIDQARDAGGQPLRIIRRNQQSANPMLDDVGNGADPATDDW